MKKKRRKKKEEKKKEFHTEQCDDIDGRVQHCPFSFDRHRDSLQGHWCCNVNQCQILSRLQH